MPRNEIPFYRENYTKRVGYEVTWIDRVFADWLESVYGSQESALDRWASVVSLAPADDIAKSLDTGGRVFIYNLKKPFFDPVSGLPCYQIDVKGVGLTKSGYLQDSKSLEPEDERKELMWHPYREVYFGYENLTRQRAVVRDLRAARRRGHCAPIPLAILNLKQMVYDGKVRSVDRLRKALEIEWAEDFALVIRGYPVTATRICDLTCWDGFVTPLYINHNTVGDINWARAAWEKFELPKFMAAAEGGFDLEPGLSYFDWFLRTAYRELTLMLTTGLSPSSSHENSTDHAHHTHLQNHSTANSHVEWTPLGRIDDTSSQRNQRLAHLYEIIEAEHDAVVNIGACSLNPDDFHLIPSFVSFLDSVTDQLRGKRNCLTRTAARQINEFGAPGRGDTLISFLKKNEKKFIPAY